MFDVVAFGEAMIRLSPPHFMRLEQTHTLDVVVGGGELNVAVSCSRLGLRTAWVSRLTDNPLGRMIRNKAREQGVNTDYCLWTKGDRIGLYFMEFGAAPRASSVLYDRVSSAIANIRPGEVDWGKVLNGAKLFHVSGITPALSRSAGEVTMEALKAAKAAGCQISYDLNYRSKLWSAEEARRIQTPMMEYVDILISTEEDTRVVFGISAQGTDDKSFTDVKAEGYKMVAKTLQERFKFKAVAITLRRTITVWRNGWSAIAYDGKRFYEDIEREVEIVDRIGGGDSFSAGLIYGYLKGDLDYGLRFGNAFSALKHSIPGDLNWVNVDEVEGLMKGSGSLRVQR